MEIIYNITLNLTAKQIELLRNSTSDLGLKDKDCVAIQLSIANAILDSNYLKDKYAKSTVEKQ